MLSSQQVCIVTHDNCDKPAQSSAGRILHTWSQASSVCRRRRSPNLFKSSLLSKRSHWKKDTYGWSGAVCMRIEEGEEDEVPIFLCHCWKSISQRANREMREQKNEKPSNAQQLALDQASRTWCSVIHPRDFPVVHGHWLIVSRDC